MSHQPLSPRPSTLSSPPLKILLNQMTAQTPPYTAVYIYVLYEFCGAKWYVIICTSVLHACVYQQYNVAVRMPETTSVYLYMPKNEMACMLCSVYVWVSILMILNMRTNEPTNQTCRCVCMPLRGRVRVCVFGENEKISHIWNWKKSYWHEANICLWL